MAAKKKTKTPQVEIDAAVLAETVAQPKPVCILGWRIMAKCHNNMNYLSGVGLRNGKAVCLFHLDSHKAAIIRSESELIDALEICKYELPGNYGVVFEEVPLPDSTELTSFFNQENKLVREIDQLRHALENCIGPVALDRPAEELKAVTDKLKIPASKTDTVIDIAQLKQLAKVGGLPDLATWRNVLSYCASMEEDLVSADKEFMQTSDELDRAEQTLAKYHELYGALDPFASRRLDDDDDDDALSEFEVDFE